MARIWFLLIPVLLIGVLVTACTGSTPALTPTSVPVPQSTATAVVQQGTLAVSIDTAGAATSQSYVSGQQGVEMIRVKLSATGEDAKVRKLVLGTFNASGNIAKVNLLGTGLPVNPSIPLVAGQAVFSFAPGSEIVVPAHGIRVLTAVADITQFGTTIAGQVVTMGVRDVVAIGSVSGATFSHETPGGIPPAFMGNPMRMEEVEPVIIRHSDSPAGVQVPGVDEVVAVFQVTASGFRDLTFNSLVLEKVGSNNPDKNVRNFSLWKGSVRIAQIGTEVGAVPFGFQEQIIVAGQTEVLTVRADTRQVRVGVATDTRVIFSVKIFGTPGPFVQEGGGFSWDYTPLGIGFAAYRTQTDSYPIQGGILEY